MMNSKVLQYLLLTGSLYFVCMAIAHFFGIKWPLLFVYYDVPFYAYQDKIISFAVVAYAGLFYSAARDRAVVPVTLMVLAVTILGLISVNLSDSLVFLLTKEQSTLPYWIQTGLFTCYLLILIVLYYRDTKHNQAIY